MTLMSSGSISGALATPLTRPLDCVSMDLELQRVGGMVTHALLTKTSISLNSAGREGTKFLMSSGLLTSSCTGNTFTPSPTSSLISLASSCRESIRLAVTIIFKSLGKVRANSLAVLRPIPDEAPVTRTVLPSRRFAIAVAIVRLTNAGWTAVRKGSGVDAENNPGEGESCRRDLMVLRYARRSRIKILATGGVEDRGKENGNRENEKIGARGGSLMNHRPKVGMACGDPARPFRDPAGPGLG